MCQVFLGALTCYGANTGGPVVIMNASLGWSSCSVLGSSTSKQWLWCMARVHWFNLAGVKSTLYRSVWYRRPSWGNDDKFHMRHCLVSSLLLCRVLTRHIIRGHLSVLIRSGLWSTAYCLIRCWVRLSRLFICLFRYEAPSGQQLIASQGAAHTAYTCSLVRPRSKGHVEQSGHPLIG